MKFNNILVTCTLEDCLLNDKGEIHDLSAKNLDYFIKVGGNFVITSRLSPIELDKLKLHKYIDFKLPIIALNGAITYEYNTIKSLKGKNKTFKNYTSIEKHVASELVSKIITNFNDVGIEIYTQDGVDVISFSKITQQNLKRLKKPLIIKEQRFIKTYQNWFKVNFTHENEEILKEVYNFVEKNYNKFIKMEFFNQNNLEIYSIETCKSTAILKLIGEHNISEDFVHPIGVNISDINLMKKFKYNFCVANAHKDINDISLIKLPDNNKPLMYYVVEQLEKKY